MSAFTRVTPRVLAALALGLFGGLAAGPVLAQAPAAPASGGAAGPQPPMNDFYQAFYRCDGGGAFNLDYDSDQPTKVQLTANDGTKVMDLKRAPSPQGFEFTAGAAKFWTDGKTVTVEGTKTALKNCKKAK
jgi:membrane-bound inhibitor of C-type lysozyme